MVYQTGNPRRKPKRKSPRELKLHPQTQRALAKSVARALSELRSEPESELRQNKNQDDSLSLPEIGRLRVLLVSSITEEEWRTEQLVTEQLRLLTRETTAIKAYPSFLPTLSLLRPDILLLLGSRLSNGDIPELSSFSGVKAVWLDDAAGTSEKIAQLAAKFDFVFTQNPDHLSYYRAFRCHRVYCLPFAADPARFRPGPADERFQSEILVLGDAGPREVEYIRLLLSYAETRRLAVSGGGWEPYLSDSIAPAPPEDLPYYLNGAQAVVCWQPEPSPLLQAGACGAFILVKDRPFVRECFTPDHDLVTFQTSAELIGKLDYYHSQPEEKRKIASAALWNARYRYSHLQRCVKLLYHIAAV